MFGLFFVRVVRRGGGRGAHAFILITRSSIAVRTAVKLGGSGGRLLVRLLLFQYERLFEAFFELFYFGLGDVTWLSGAEYAGRF